MHKNQDAGVESAAVPGVGGNEKSVDVALVGARKKGNFILLHLGSMWETVMLRYGRSKVKGGVNHGDSGAKPRGANVYPKCL